MAKGGDAANRVFGNMASRAAAAAGHPATFVTCLLIVVVWALSGPLFGFSDTWQLVINTGTTIVTFLMVFLIQNTQNRDGRAIQTKLDELILTSAAEDDFVGIEKLTDKELAQLEARCVETAKSHAALAERATKEIHSRRSGPQGKSSTQTQAKPVKKTAATTRRRPTA
jgi:low affinity Fe/Cu permease